MNRAEWTGTMVALRNEIQAQPTGVWSRADFQDATTVGRTRVSRETAHERRVNAAWANYHERVGR